MYTKCKDRLEPNQKAGMSKNRPGLFICSVFLLLIVSGCGTGDTGGQIADGTITLTWDSVTDPSAAGYRIYYGSLSRTVSGSYEHSKDIGRGNQVSNTSTSFTLTGLIKKQTYYIAVTAYDNDGNESDYSNEVSGTAR